MKGSRAEALNLRGQISGVSRHGRGHGGDKRTERRMERLTNKSSPVFYKTLAAAQKKEERKKVRKKGRKE